MPDRLINLTMDERSNRVYSLIQRNRKAIGQRILGMKQPTNVKWSDVVLLFMPLLFILIFIPPGNTDAPKAQPSMIPAKETSVRIVVYNPEASLVDDVDLEDYLVGVVAAEMPTSFHEEALKAQAVAARTFAVSRMKGLYGTSTNHFGAHVCTDSGHCQAWVSKEVYLARHGSEEGWLKIQKAVADTRGQIMTYDGVVINPLYHANSGGATEDIQEVWSMVGEVPYLKSVYSPEDANYAQYEKESLFAWEDMVKKIKAQYPEARLGEDPKKEIEILSYSTSGRVTAIRLGSITLSGVDFRELMSLRSTYIEISFPDKNTVKIVTKGYGHGVGMSQCGADALGRQGMDYIEILEHYYTGVKVEELAQ